MLSKILARGAMTVAAAAFVVSTASAADISGAGATFPYPVYAKWADAYKKTTGIGLNYQSIGSGGGIKQIKAKTVTFGASDMPLEVAELDQAGLIQFPAIMGGAVPVINVKGVAPGELKLDGKTLAAIYNGDVAKWNDEAIVKLNPGLKLPATAIAPVYRSDGSGTNFLFTNYLAKTNPKFKEQVGVGTAVQWPTGIGAKGNEGVANMVKQTDGAIGYVEYAYAKQNTMTVTQLQNKAGKFVKPEAAAFAAAAANAQWDKAPGFGEVLTDEPGDASWPITGASFILVYKQPANAADTAAALTFFDWAYKNGGDMAKELDYVPMPAEVVALIEKTWAEKVQADGKPVFTPAK